ncbi:MAG: HlyD family efflux transporter periplasmic adaptor subunit [Propionibacteriaceae bacterium]|nr:HlyD family efflux transporter periplasmic adaptor subunit [Propionibacteriaceae bacterium]
MIARRPVALAAGLVLLAGCASAPSDITVSGTVDDTLTTVTVPNLAVPTVNLDAGFTDTTGTYNPTSGRTASQSSSVGATYSVGTTARLAEVNVREGDTVKAGDVVATIDRAPLQAQLAAAKADAAVAAAQPDLLGDKIDDTWDKQADIAETRADVVDAIHKLTKTKAKLLKARKTIRKNLPKARAGLKAINAAIAQIPPGVPVPDELLAQKKKLQKAIRKMTAGLRQINKALPQLNAGLKKARKGLTKLDDARAKITDARGTLEGLQDVAGIQADALRVPIDIAKIQLAMTELVAPVDGVVVSAAAPGDALAPGATVVSIRETTPSTVTAWLSPAQLAQVCTGDAATIATDWSTATVPATLTRIGTSSQYPPTSVATDEVHLTRAVEAQFTATGQLPAGVPVEVTISGCRPAANSDETNG